MKESADLYTATGLQSHSAQVKPGNWFYMLGDPSVTKKFIPEIEARGAVRIVTDTDCILETALPVSRVQNARSQYLIDCSKFYEQLFDEFHAFGVTGTKGKTSIAYGLHKLFQSLGKKSVYIGTLGICYGDGLIAGSNTTPGLWELIQILQQARKRGIKRLFMEVSSQGLLQHRVPCQMFYQRAFTDLSPEHLDAHQTMQNYFEAKSLFFNPQYPLANSSFEVFCLDRSSYIDQLSELCQKPVNRFGLKNNRSFLLSNPSYDLGKSCFTLRIAASSYDFEVPWTGFFNLENLCLIMEVALSEGINPVSLQHAIAQLNVVPGRLEEIKGHPKGRVFVDYAHSTESLKFVCEAVRPMANQRLIVLFGCGGNRDRSKRPAMAQAASQSADLIILSNDNPRNENPETILDEIISGLPQDQNFKRIADRAEAIHSAIFDMDDDDVLLICGKGHESTMTSQGLTWKSDDRQLAREAIASRRQHQVHQVAHLIEIPQAVLLQKGFATGCNGFQFDSRKVQPGDAFVAMRGESQDGFDFIHSAASNGAELIITDRMVESMDPRLTVIFHPKPVEFLQIAARNYRDSHPAYFIGITGSVGKTTCKDSLTHLLGCSAYGSLGNFNNTLGLPISLLNMPATKRFGVFEMGISIPGEMIQLSQCLRPDAMIFLPVYGSHKGNFESRQHLLNEKVQSAKFMDQQDQIFAPDSIREELEISLHRKVTSLNFSCDDLLNFGKGPALSVGLAREVAMHLGIDRNLVQSRLINLNLSPLRMEKRFRAGWTFLLDCYNAAPESTQMFLESIDNPQSSKIVLADMLELGEDSIELHLNILRIAFNKGFTKVYLLGQFYYDAWQLIRHEFAEISCDCFLDKNLLLQELKSQHPGFLGLKGSRFFKLETLADALGDG